MKNEPRLIFWELTKKCNLQCQHCRAEADDSYFEGEMNFDNVKKTIDNISSTSSTGPVVRETGALGNLIPAIFLIALAIGFLRATAPAPANANPATPLAADGSQGSRSDLLTGTEDV